MKQTTEQIEALLATGKDLIIINGTVNTYYGKRTVRAIKARLTHERCNGDRWACVDTEDRMVLAGVI